MSLFRKIRQVFCLANYEPENYRKAFKKYEKMDL